MASSVLPGPFFSMRLTRIHGDVDRARRSSTRPGKGHATKAGTSCASAWPSSSPVRPRRTQEALVSRRNAPLTPTRPATSGLERRGRRLATAAGRRTFPGQSYHRGPVGWPLPVTRPGRNGEPLQPPAPPAPAHTRRRRGTGHPSARGIAPNLPRTGHQPTLDPPLASPDQWQGRTIPPHPARRMGLPTALHLRHRTANSVPRLAGLVQLPPTTHRNRRSDPSQPRHQPVRTTHLGDAAGAVAGFPEPDLRR